MEGWKERSAVLAQVREDRVFAGGEVASGHSTSQSGDMITEIDRQPAVPVAQGLESAPQHFAGSRQRVGVCGVVGLDACSKDFRLED